jgi:hypothetical protein
MPIRRGKMGGWLALWLREYRLDNGQSNPNDIEASVWLQKSRLASSTVRKSMSTWQAAEIGFFSMKGCSLGGVPQAIIGSQQSSCVLGNLHMWVTQKGERSSLFHVGGITELPMI